MPPIKPPTKLVDFASQAVENYYVSRIVESLQRSDDIEFERIANFVKDNVCVCIPKSHFDRFTINLLRSISRKFTPKAIIRFCEGPVKLYSLLAIIEELSTLTHYREVSEVLLEMLYWNLSKFRQLKNISVHQNNYVSLEGNKYRSKMKDRYCGEARKCDFKNIVELECPMWWLGDVDAFLTPERFPKLKRVTFTVSADDSGALPIIRALSKFTQLQEVDLHDAKYDRYASDCGKDMETFLSGNERLTRLSIYFLPNIFYQLENKYPHLKSFHVIYPTCTRSIDDLIFIRNIFPELTSLVVNCYDSPLYLPEVVKFPRVSSLSLGSLDSATTNFEYFSIEMGSRLVHLDLHTSRGITMVDLDSIRRWCTNLEHLRFLFRPTDDSHRLLVPRFDKLKRLMTVFDNEDDDEDLDVDEELILNRMPRLEYLKYIGFKIPDEKLEFMIRDSDNFPRLSKIALPWIHPDTLKRLRRIIVERNLDIVVELMID